MTTDERLDRLTERHEALTQSVELLLHHSKETDRKIDRLTDELSLIAKFILNHEERLRTIEDR